MTRQEFEALLLKKGILHSVGSIGGGGWECYQGIQPKENCEISFIVFQTIVELNLWVYGKPLFYERRFAIKDITEHKLDEILSQFTKIKTALEIINHIAKGE